MIETTQTPNNMVICFALAAEGSYLIMGLNECRMASRHQMGLMRIAVAPCQWKGRKLEWT
jgi:hypothetical protein